MNLAAAPMTTAETVHARLEAYNASKRAPILPYYREKHRLLHVVDGMAEMDEVERQIEAVLRDVGVAPPTAVN